MSRGRKPKLRGNVLNWQQFFNKNVGLYLQIIIIELSATRNKHAEDASALLIKIKEKKEQLFKGNKLNKEKGLPPIKDEEIPFEIPENWLWCRLGEIIEFTDNLNIEAKLSADTLINYVDIDAIDNQKYQIRESKLKPVSELSSRARRVLRKGYIVYSLVRPYLNNIAIIEDEKPNYIGSTGLAVFNGILVANKFLKIFLLSDYVRKLYLKMFSGFNSPSITHEQFTSTLIPLPPLSEQNKILDFLNDVETNNLRTEGYYFNNEVEQRIINLHKSQFTGSEISLELIHQQDLVKQLRQSFLREAMQGKLVKQNSKDGNATDLLQKIKAEKEKLIAEKILRKEKELPLINEEEIPFTIPANWVWCRLGDLVRISSGDGLTSEQMDKNGTIPVYGGNGINGYHNKFNLEKETIVIGRVGYYCGCVHLTKKNAWVTDNAFTVSYSEENIYREFLIHLLRWADLGKQQFAGSQPVISGHRVYPKLIPLPPLPEQHRIVKSFEQLMQLCDELQYSIQQSKIENEKLLQGALRYALKKEEETLIT